MERKVCFFDIDGTIWNDNNEIPQSTIKAIRTLRKNGHLAFLCSGRSRGYIRHPDLLGIGFDGIVAAAGTMIEYQGEVIFYHELPIELTKRAYLTLKECGCRTIMEGKEYLYFNEEDFGDDAYGDKLRKDIGDHILSIDEYWERWEVSKMSCATERADVPKCMELLGDDFDFMIHNPYVFEMVPKGFHKGTGVKKVCELLNIPLENSFAFGDSINDLGMLTTAGCAVVMGNGVDACKAVADFVTKDMEDDGIYYACKHFGLI